MLWGAKLLAVPPTPLRKYIFLKKTSPLYLRLPCRSALDEASSLRGSGRPLADQKSSKAVHCDAVGVLREKFAEAVLIVVRKRRWRRSVNLRR